MQVYNSWIFMTNVFMTNLPLWQMFLWQLFLWKIFSWQIYLYDKRYLYDKCTFMTNMYLWQKYFYDKCTFMTNVPLWQMFWLNLSICLSLEVSYFSYSATFWDIYLKVSLSNNLPCKYIFAIPWLSVHRTRI